MKYKVVWAAADTLEGALTMLEKQVENMCSSGWKVQGGISVTVRSSYCHYVCQAMVK